MLQKFKTPIITNDQSIERVVSAGMPVILVFLNGRALDGLKQAMERLAQEYAGELLIAQIQIKDNPESCRRYAAGQAPALVTVHKKQVVTQADGITASDFEKHVLFSLGKGPQPEQRQAAPKSGESTDRQATSDGKPSTVSDATFDQEVLHSNLPVLVDFWAPWCGPCRMTEPVLEKLAHELRGRLRIAKVNVDENPTLSQKYGVQSIPTMMIVKNGQIVDRWAGTLPETVIKGRITLHT